MRDAFYFPHDYTARNDQKILMLRGEFGNEGYAVYFMILESMAEEGNSHLNRVAIGGLSIGYGVSRDFLTKMINYCIEIHLLQEGEDGIYSKRMMDHKRLRKDLSEAGKSGAKKRRQNSHPNSLAIATPMQRKGKESITTTEEIKNILTQEEVEQNKQALIFLWKMIEAGYECSANKNNILKDVAWIYETLKTYKYYSDVGGYEWDRAKAKLKELKDMKDGGMEVKLFKSKLNNFLSPDRRKGKQKQ